LHACHIAQKITQSVRCANDRGLDDLQCNSPGLDSRFAANLQYAQGFYHSIPAAWGHCAPLCEGSMGRALSIEVIVLAAPPSVQFVRGGHLQHLNVGTLQISQKPCAIAA